MGLHHQMIAKAISESMEPRIFLHFQIQVSSLFSRFKKAPSVDSESKIGLLTSFPTLSFPSKKIPQSEEKNSQFLEVF